jgi:hypothetical protein
VQNRLLVTWLDLAKRETVAAFKNKLEIAESMCDGSSMVFPIRLVFIFFSPSLFLSQVDSIWKIKTALVL